MLLMLVAGCENGGESIDKTAFYKNPHTTDSLVVAQLIQRSEEFFKENPEVPDVYDGFLREAFDISVRGNLVTQEIVIFNLVGKRYRNRAQYGESLKFYYKALDFAQNIDDMALLAEIYNQLGVVYRRTDDNAMALDLHFKALKYSEELKDTFNIGVAINSIGNVNFNLGRYHSAVEYFHRSFEFAKLMKNTLGMAINTNNIGESYLKMGFPDSSLVYQHYSLQHNLKIGSKTGESICYNSIGAAYIAKGNLGKALGFLKRSLQLNKSIGDPMQVAISMSRVGEVYLLMEDFEQAYTYILESYDLAKKIGSRFQAEESSRQLSRYYEIQREFALAMDYYKEATAYKDTILNEKSSYHLTTFEVLFEAEQQKERILQLNQETLSQKYIMERQRWFIIIFGILAAAAFVFTFLLVNQHRLRNKYQDLRNQHKLLRSQMNPHFIFNALSAIQVYVLEHDIEKSTKFLTDFAKLMRQVLKLSQQDYITLKDETEILAHYLDLQQLRFNIPFIYDIEVDEEMDSALVVVPPMITQPFVENAVEHGIKVLQGEGRIKISFHKEGGQMVVKVEDNGIGIIASRQQKSEKGHESMALKITRERLDVIQRDSGGKVSLEIVDKKKINPFDRGTIVKIVFPVVKISSATKKHRGT
ncbi:MAG TPA: histidine kinase [Marinilabiliaceae bacterium]|nr:histidine kinase [Marinilabiliaceae bacterium]